MTEVLSTHWWPITTTVYVGGFLLIACWELLTPRRDWSVSTMVRWTNNFAVFMAGAAMSYLLLPTFTVGFAFVVDEHGWGLLHGLGVSGAWTVAVGIVILDFAQYLEHVMVHRISLFWRCHRTHHADLDYDVTTGFRFHPLEVMLSAAWRMAVIATLGIPIAAVLLAELLLMAMNIFVHGNVRLPLAVDRALRRVIVTPDFHRVHHSIEFDESNANFGSILSVWDRVFHTYRDQPRAGHESMTIGLAGFQQPKHMYLPWMLINPFLSADNQIPAHAEQFVSGQNSKAG